MSEISGPLRISHVIVSLDAKAGGLPVVCTRLAAAQIARSQTVAIVTEISPPDQIAPAGVRISLVPHVGLSAAILGGTVRRALSAACRGADIVHIHGVWDPLLLAAGAEARRSEVPYVVTPHGMLDPWSLAQKRWKKRLALALGTRTFLDRAAAIHTLNRDEAALLAPLGLKAPIAVVPNGVDFSEIDPLPGRAEFRAGRPALGKNPYILFLSRLHFKKGLDILADAFASVAAAHPEVHLVVAGGDDGERSNFDRRVRDRDLTGRVHLVGPLYGRAKWAALAGAAAFCLPSRQEGFSIAILEALACACPVVISRECHFPEVASVGAGVETSLDPKDVAGGLSRVLADPLAAAAMGAAGRRLVREHYTWDRVGERCDKMYADAGARRQTGADGDRATIDR